MKFNVVVLAAAAVFASTSSSTAFAQSTRTQPNGIEKPRQFQTTDFCQASGLAASDGSQIRTGACSSTPQGAIPSVDNMLSTIITSPANQGTINARENVTVTINFLNMETGFFADPQAEYYLSPQTLNQQGIIQGHQHITVQEMQGANAALDPTKFVFFKGLNDRSADGSSLSVVIPAGTFQRNGLHRICSMAGTDGHQPPVMPVAQRGAQDDCIRVTVEGV
ncbi:hypothetical protein BC832DRAFT_565397 [Gaertneriomyces semiglobifer]|nr:hypothetical protein BC832DRAFT_565397 [Gaertneriomyces semiglobifer]